MKDMRLDRRGTEIPTNAVAGEAPGESERSERELKGAYLNTHLPGYPGASGCVRCVTYIY